MRNRPPRLLLLAVAAVVSLAGCADFSTEPPVETIQPSLSAAAMHPQDESSFPIPTTQVAPSPQSGAAPSTGPSTPEDPCRPSDPTIIAACLSAPWGLAVLPDGASALVGERTTGRILLVRPQTEPQLVVQIDGIDATGDGGLLGIALSPSFAEDGLIYAYVTTVADNRIIRIATGDVPKDIFTGIPKGATHNGGRITFGSDGFLYIATGDAGTAGAGTNPASLAGKVLRIDEFGNPVAPGSGAGPGSTTTPGSTTPGTATPTSPAPGTSAVPPTPEGGAASTGAPTTGGAAADPTEAIYSSGLVNPTGLCRLTAGGIGVIDRVGAADVLAPATSGADVTTATPIWSFQLVDGGGNDCAENETTLGATSLDQELVTTLTLGQNGGFTGQPTQLAKGLYGRLLTLEPGTQGLLWATTSNRDGSGEPAPRDDMVVVIPTGGGGGDDSRD